MIATTRSSRSRLAGLYGVASLVFGCQNTADGLLVITVTADTPVADIAQLRVKLYDQTRKTTAEVDVPGMPGAPYTIPPSRSISVILAHDTGRLDIDVEARNSSGTRLSAGRKEGVAPPGAGARRDETVKLGEAMPVPDGGADGGDGDVPGEPGGDVGLDLGEGPVVDVTPPTSWADPDKGKYTSPLTVTLMASEPGTIRYTIDGSLPTQASARYTTPITFMGNGTHTLRFRAWDLAGNAETPGNTKVYELGDPPIVRAVTPMMGSAGTQVTVTGAQLDTAIMVLVGGSNGVAGRITTQAATEIRFTVPPDAYSGPIVVRNQYGDTPYRDPAAGGFRMGNCLESGFYTDVLPDPGDGALIFDGPWTEYYAVPSQSGAEIRMIRKLGTPWGRVDLSDLPGGGTVQAVDYMYLGPNKGRMVVARRSAAGAGYVTFVSLFGAFAGEFALTRIGTMEPGAVGVTQITGGLDAGKLAIVTPTRVFITDDLGNVTRSFENGCRAVASGVTFIREAAGLRKNALAVACGAAIRFLGTSGADLGEVAGRTFMKGIASVPGTATEPDWLVWTEDNLASHTRIAHVDLQDGTSVFTRDLSGSGVSAELHMGLATLYDVNFRATQLAAVQVDRIVRFAFDGQPISSTRIMPGSLAVGAAMITAGAGTGRLAVLDGVVRKINIYDLGTGTRVQTPIDLSPFIAPANAVEGVLFHPTGPGGPNGYFGILDQTKLELYLLEQTLATKRTTPLGAQGAYSSVAHVLDGTGTGYGYIAALNGRIVELRRRDDTLVAALKLGCQVDARGEIAGLGLGDRRLAVFDHPDGRIDYVDLKVEGF